jgi:hypothetical protein
MHATCKLGWQDARRHSTYLDLQKVLGRAVQLLEGLRARIRERLHRGAGFGGELAEGIWRKRAAMDAGLGSRPANHWPDGLARTCQPLRNHGWRFGDRNSSLTNTTCWLGVIQAIHVSYYIDLVLLPVCYTSQDLVCHDAHTSFISICEDAQPYVTTAFWQQSIGVHQAHLWGLELSV